MDTDILTFKSLDNNDVFKLIDTTRAGLDYRTFDKLTSSFPLSVSDWSRILNVSERTIQRNKSEKRRFDAIHSERLLLIVLLFRKGIEVFGNTSNFFTWIDSKNIALGGLKPTSLLDNSFGIDLVKDELIRIEHGILA